MSTDVLSEVLHAVRLRGAVFFEVKGAAPWVAEAPDAKWVAPHVMPGAEHVIEYHVVTSGSCYGGLLGESPSHLQEGDVIVFPQGDAHVMSSAPGMRGPLELSNFRRPENGRLPIAMSMQGQGEIDSRLVCGFIGYDARPFNPLLKALPRLIHVQQKSAEDGALLQHLVRAALAESTSRREGGETMLSRLSELLFVEVVRNYCASLPSDTKGWLAGLRDEIVGRALSILHDRPAESWSLDSLSKEVGTSRSLLAERFNAFVGSPPMHYLARWRMQLAASHLSSNMSMAEVAQRVGYGSEAAFSRAFKRLAGVAPSAWREGVRPDIAFTAPRTEDSEEVETGT